MKVEQSKEWWMNKANQEDEAAVSAGVYESAVKGRADFRQAYREARQEIEQLREFVAWVDTWFSNPAGSYSAPALAGLFSMARERIAALTRAREALKARDAV